MERVAIDSVAQWFDETGNALLQEAKRQAEQMHSAHLNGLHVMLAALALLRSNRDPGPMYPNISKLFTLSDAERANLRGSLKSQAYAYPTDPSLPPGALVPELEQSIGEAKKRSNGGRISDVVLLWAILASGGENTPLGKALRAVHDEIAIDWSALTQELDTLIATRDRVAIGRPSPRSKPLYLDRYVSLQPPTAGFTYASRHTELMRVVAGEMAIRSAGEIVVVTGQNGSPIHRVIRVLTDAFGSGEHYRFARLEPYAKVYVINIPAILRLGRGNASASLPTPDRVLEAGFQWVIEDDAVLVIDGMEQLVSRAGEDNSWRETLLAQLANPPSSAVILGLYTQEKEDEPATLALPGLRMRAVHARTYGRKGTMAVLAKYSEYIADWEKQGVTFTADAFDDAFDLEGGIVVNEKVRWLPYLVASLARAVITTVADTEHRDKEIGDMAAAAQKRLAELPRPANPMVIERYQLQLGKAAMLMERLIDGKIPALKSHNGKLEISRAMVTAQLLGSSRSYFTYPKEVPPPKDYPDSGEVGIVEPEPPTNGGPGRRGGGGGRKAGGR